MENLTISVDGNSSPLGSKAKTFSTGSTGYFIYGKVDVDGVPHQMSGNLVKIGSKPKPAQS